jgi:hypothetical protein
VNTSSSASAWSRVQQAFDTGSFIEMSPHRLTIRQ